MKRIYLIAVMLCVMAAGLSSCKNDDNDNPVRPDNKYRLEKMVTDFGNNWSGINRDFVYDREGRVESFTQILDREDDMFWKYEYTSSLIVSWTKFEGTDWEILLNYFLENGLVSHIKNDKISIDCHIEYDSQNQIKKMKNKDGEVLLEFEWKDGNISKVIYYSESEPSCIYTYEYGDDPNTLCMLPCLIPISYEDEFDPYIIANGYFGKLSKNLPLKQICMEESSDKPTVTTYSYSGFNQDGYPSTMTIKNWEDDCRADFVWKK